MGFYRGVEESASEKKLKKIPEKGFGLYFYTLFNHATKMLLLNLLFIAFSLPVVTLPAAITAVSRVIMLLMKDGYVHVWQDFIKEFKTSFFKALAIGAGFVILFAVFYLAAKIYPVIFKNDEAMSVVFFALSVALMIILGVVFSYAIPMISMVDLPLGRILKNSCILLYAKPLTSIILAILVIAENYIIFGIFPESLPLVAFIIPVAVQLGVCVAVKPAFEELIYDN